MNGIFLLLLAVVCANVATLVFARTATRGWEIAVRNALGASRGRIVTQLFLEALVLSGIAALLGLALAKVVLRFAVSLRVSDTIPFWVLRRLASMAAWRYGFAIRCRLPCGCARSPPPSIR